MGLASSQTSHLALHGLGAKAVTAAPELSCPAALWHVPAATCVPLSDASLVHDC